MAEIYSHCALFPSVLIMLGVVCGQIGDFLGKAVCLCGAVLLYNRCLWFSLPINLFCKTSVIIFVIAIILFVIIIRSFTYMYDYIYLSIYLYSWNSQRSWLLCSHALDSSRFAYKHKFQSRFSLSILLVLSLFHSLLHCHIDNNLHLHKNATGCQLFWNKLPNIID